MYNIGYSNNDDSAIILILFLCCCVSIILGISIGGFFIYRNSTKDGSIFNNNKSPKSHSGVIPLDSVLKKNTKPWYSSGIKKNQWSVEGDILKVKIKKGIHGGQSGGAFDANPNKMFPSDSVTFSYDVYFPDDFDFVKGGKLPGVCLGTNKSGCANGGDWKKEEGSIRPMWRANDGKDPYIIGYIYLPDSKGPKHAYDNQGQQYKNATRPGDRAGHDVWIHEKSLSIAHGWNSIQVKITLNTPGKKDGVLEMTVNGVTRRVDDVNYRSSDSIQINKARIVSFFGGGSNDWNSPKDTTISFKNFSFST